MKSFQFMKESNNVYKTTYKDYSNHSVIMVSTDRQILVEKSAVRQRMLEYSKQYKELHIIVFSDSKIEDKEIAQNCKVYSTKSFVRWNYVSDARKIGVKIIDEINPEIPILITCQDPFETALVGKCLNSKRKNSELLIQIHTDLYSPYFIDARIGILNSILNRIRLFISRFTLNHANIIRVVSNKIADSLVKRGFSPDDIIVKPIDINIDYIKNDKTSFILKEKFPRFKNIILMISRIEAEKNISMAIDAMKIVVLKKPDTGLVIVGSGTMQDYLKRRSEILKISKNIVFEGWQTDLTPYYRGCDVFLVCSWYEGYGLTFKEAEANNCKIISTDVGIAKDVGATIVNWTSEDIATKILDNIK